MAKKEIKAWALEVIDAAILDYAALDEITTELMNTAGLLGVHITPDSHVLAMYRSQEERNAAYTKLNDGDNNIRVALILPPAYIPADSIGGNNGRQ